MDKEKQLKTLLRLFPYIHDKTRAEQLKIDEESVHYISLREIACKISSIITWHLKRLQISTNNCTITDATAGVGGDTISFGTIFKEVNAIELNELRFEYLVNNINVYDLKNITTYNEDCINIIGQISHQDVVFIDPPWGGRTYKQYNNLKLNISDISIEEFCNRLLDINNNKLISYPSLIVLKLPQNYDLKHLYDVVESNLIFLHELKKMNIIVIVNPHSEYDTELK